jgi:hypothetical protein
LRKPSQNPLLERKKITVTNNKVTTETAADDDMPEQHYVHLEDDKLEGYWESKFATNLVLILFSSLPF